LLLSEYFFLFFNHLFFLFKFLLVKCLQIFFCFLSLKLQFLSLGRPEYILALHQTLTTFQLAKVAIQPHDIWFNSLALDGFFFSSSLKVTLLSQGEAFSTPAPKNIVVLLKEPSRLGSRNLSLPVLPYSIAAMKPQASVRGFYT